MVSVKKGRAPQSTIKHKESLFRFAFEQDGSRYHWAFPGGGQAVVLCGL